MALVQPCPPGSAPQYLSLPLHTADQEHTTGGITFALRQLDTSRCSRRYVVKSSSLPICRRSVVTLHPPAMIDEVNTERLRAALHQAEQLGMELFHHALCKRGAGLD